MAQFSRTHGVASEIERLIVGPQQRLVLVTPYLKVSQILIERLLDGSRKGVAISLVYGKVDLSDEEMARLRRIPKLDLRFSEHLHAKCYFNESRGSNIQNHDAWVPEDEPLKFIEAGSKNSLGQKRGLT